MVCGFAGITTDRKKRRDRCRRHNRFVLLLSSELRRCFQDYPFVPARWCMCISLSLTITSHHTVIPISVGERQTRDRNWFGRSQFEFRFAPIFNIGRRGRFQERHKLDLNPNQDISFVRARLSFQIHESESIVVIVFNYLQFAIPSQTKTKSIDHYCIIFISKRLASYQLSNQPWWCSNFSSKRCSPGN